LVIVQKSGGNIISQPAFPYMARYFFNIHGAASGPDQVGEELPNDDAAWHEATLIAGELFKDIDGKFRPGQEWSLEVTDERRKPIYSVHVRGKRL
jgi:hypothetical protein